MSSDCILKSCLAVREIIRYREAGQKIEAKTSV